MSFARLPASCQAIRLNGPTPPGRWQDAHSRYRIGATSWENVGPAARAETEIAQRAAARFGLDLTPSGPGTGAARECSRSKTQTTAGRWDRRELAARDRASADTGSRPPGRPEWP